ncbi:phage tail tape measure C-terminal domain-containing protein [Roseisalinus antarcticus]|uniref:Lambda phage tail tape-measure protein (Tape_meas_lam_C) n=1 Tax=Roseisalinus antarcticus TaxID=254357 RepID=A0A1Y5U220_9RHOB|nr:phage tail tape measure C-terminal domain-containing protein [Roseisalinus antarcticus]SLN74610.1 Lambda phage tail tape-measure protein (Tape_meas_lam_C) [Roseisalinus antarcticus]
MAEKRVSVRLAAVGGRQVRAELEGVGEAGARGFGRLSREMEAANARMAAFSRRVKIAAAAAVAAATAAGVAMVRNGLQVVDAQAKLAQSLSTTVESIQVLERAAELSGARFSEIEGGAARLTRRLSLFAENGGGPAAKAIERLGLNAQALLRLPLDQRIDAVSQAIRANASASEQAALFSQLFGDRAFIAMQRVDTATLRQATEDVRAFGVVVSEADADQIERTNDAISRLGLIWRGLSNQLAVAAAPALEAVAEAMAAMASRTGPLGIAIRGLFENIGRLTTYAATFVGFLAGRWVAGMAAAALSVRGLATALVFLRGALVRTGIGALIVGAGELIYQFGKLVKAAGGFGEAMSLLKDVAAEAWNRISLSASASWARIESGWAAMQATIYDGLQATSDAIVRWANSTVGAFVGAYDAVKATWSMLPRAIGDFTFQAANALIDGVESMINGVITRINSFITALNAALELLPGWATGEGGLSIGTLGPVDLPGVTNPFTGAAAEAGTAAGDAFRAAAGVEYLGRTDRFSGMADAARGRSDGYGEAAVMLAQAAQGPMTAWERLKELVTGTGTALDDAVPPAVRLEETLDEVTASANAAGAAGQKAGGDSKAGAEAALTGWAAVSAKLSDYAKGAMETGAQIGDALVGAFQSAENAIDTFVKTGKLSFRDLTTSLIADLAKIGARKFILGPLSKALSGALGNMGGMFANIFHAGGVVGGPAPGRMVPAMAFANAPRMHSGGMAGVGSSSGFAGLRHDEVPAILQRGERVLSRREAQGYGQEQASAPIVNVAINARDAESFRKSRTQIAADISRAVAMGRRNM